MASWLSENLNKRETITTGAGGPPFRDGAKEPAEIPAE